MAEKKLGWLGTSLFTGSMLVSPVINDVADVVNVIPEVTVEAAEKSSPRPSAKPSSSSSGSKSSSSGSRQQSSSSSSGSRQQSTGSSGSKSSSSGSRQQSYSSSNNTRPNYSSSNNTRPNYSSSNNTRPQGTGSSNYTNRPQGTSNTRPPASEFTRSQASQAINGMMQQSQRQQSSSNSSNTRPQGTNYSSSNNTRPSYSSSNNTRPLQTFTAPTGEAERTRAREAIRTELLGATSAPSAPSVTTRPQTATATPPRQQFQATEIPRGQTTAGIQAAAQNMSAPRSAQQTLDATAAIRAAFPELRQTVSATPAAAPQAVPATNINMRPGQGQGGQGVPPSNSGVDNIPVRPGQGQENKPVGPGGQQPGGQPITVPGQGGAGTVNMRPGQQSGGQPITPGQPGGSGNKPVIPGQPGTTVPVTPGQPGTTVPVTPGQPGTTVPVIPGPQTPTEVVRPGPGRPHNPPVEKVRPGQQIPPQKQPGSTTTINKETHKYGGDTYIDLSWIPSIFPTGGGFGGNYYDQGTGQFYHPYNQYWTGGINQCPYGDNCATCNPEPELTPEQHFENELPLVDGEENFVLSESVMELLDIYGFSVKKVYRLWKDSGMPLKEYLELWENEVKKIAVPKETVQDGARSFLAPAPHPTAQVATYEELEAIMGGGKLSHINTGTNGVKELYVPVKPLEISGDY